MEINDGSYETLSPDSVRAEKMTFQQLIISCLNRLHFFAPNAISKNEKGAWREWRGIETSVRLLHAFVAPYYTKDYKEKVEEIKKNLTLRRAQTYDYDYFIALQEWVEVIVEKFALVGLLPPIRVRTRSKDGTVKKL